MLAFRWNLLFLGVTGGLLGGFSDDSFTLSMRYFHLYMREPSQGQPQYVEVGYVNDEPFGHYDSNTQQMMPAGLRWIWFRELDVDYWKKQTSMAKMNEYKFSNSHLNESFDTMQCIDGCDLNDDQLETEIHRDALDGREMELCGENASYMCEHRRLLTENCIFWLYLLKTDMLYFDQPAAKVARKVGADGLETLICQVYGFYPRAINITWTKDGKFWERNNFSGNVLPNSDGTYYTWLSIRVDPKDRKRYRCHVDQFNSNDPLFRFWEETEPPTVTVISEAINEVEELLICQADGFFPEDIVVIWRKDEVWMSDLSLGDVIQNSDGTYRTQPSVKIYRKDRHHYQCHVEHSGLQEPLEVALEESVWPFVGGTIGAIAALLLVAGIILYIAINQTSDGNSKSQCEESHLKGQEECCISLEEKREATSSD